MNQSMWLPRSLAAFINRFLATFSFQHIAYRYHEQFCRPVCVVLVSIPNANNIDPYWLHSTRCDSIDGVLHLSNHACSQHRWPKFGALIDSNFVACNSLRNFTFLCTISVLTFTVFILIDSSRKIIILKYWEKIN